MEHIIAKYFPYLTPDQKEKFILLGPLYEEWNSKINVISRKDFENFYVHHVLHSLAIQRVISFSPGTKILDVGTGGGFPGVPLAILFPDTMFTLLDSIQKKIKVVTAVTGQLGLKNVIPVRSRAEEHGEKYDFVISRAVSAFPDFVSLTSQRVKPGGFNSLPNGIICLKGGDLEQELKGYRSSIRVWKIEQFFDEPYFTEKQIIYLEV
jgi:16S rRNA (guanine527-N7)-methyltransferase